MANLNLNKYRKLQQEMEGAIERADMAENTLGMLRAKNRSSSVAREGMTVRATNQHSVLSANYSCMLLISQLAVNKKLIIKLLYVIDRS